MNKSIAKTRNQLQRITYKINQLKTKYTGQTPQHTPHLTNCQNSPRDPRDVRDIREVRQSREFSYSDARNRDFRENNILVTGNSVNLTNSNVNNCKNVGNGSRIQEMYQKQFRVFRSEIYNYIDKCLIMAKDRQQDVIQKTIQSCMTTSRATPKQPLQPTPFQQQLEQRIQKVQQELTTSISNTQQHHSQSKKHQKTSTQKLATMEIKLRKQIKQIRQKIQEEYVTNNFLSEKLEFFMLEKQEKIQNFITKKINQSAKNNNSQVNKEINYQIGSFGKIKEEVRRSLEEIQGLKKGINCIGQIQEKIQVISENNQKYVKKSLNDQISKLRQQFSKKHKQSEQKSQLPITELWQKFSQIQNTQASTQKNLQSQLTQLTHFQSSLESRLKSFQTSLSSLHSQFSSSSVTSGSSVTGSSQAMLSELVPQLQQKLEVSYLKPRIEQIKRQMLSKIAQEIEFVKQDVNIIVEEQVFEKVNKFINQERVRKSPMNHDPQQCRNTTKQQLKQHQQSLKQTLLQLLQQKLSKLSQPVLTKVQPDSSFLSTSFNISQRNKTQQQQPHSYSQKNIEQIIDNKLNQFQNDINQTIKLLYEDIQGRVNEMLSHSGIKDIKQDVDMLKRQYKDLETKVKSLTLLAVGEKSSITKMDEIGESEQNLYNLRAQVYNDMGAQIDKLSNILQRAVEQMQTKIQKQDNNFSYLYQRMSKIQFDNASFKDKLTSLLSSGQKAVGTPTMTSTTIINKSTSPLIISKSPSRDSLSGNNVNCNNKGNGSVHANGNYLLDALGQYNAGGYFFQT